MGIKSQCFAGDDMLPDLKEIARKRKELGRSRSVDAQKLAEENFALENAI